MAYMFADHRVKYCPKKHEEISKSTSIQRLTYLVEHNRYVLHHAITTSVYEELLSDTPDLFQSLRNTFEYVNIILTTNIPIHLKFAQYQSISHMLIDAVEIVNNDPRIVQYKKAQEKIRIEKWRLARKNKEHVIIKKTQVIKKSLLETPFEDCFCMETHLKKDTVQTSCGHCFGKECYERMLILANNDPRKNICPMCRTKGPKLTYWKARATYKKANHVVAPQPIQPIVENETDQEIVQFLENIFQEPEQEAQPAENTQEINRNYMPRFVVIDGDYNEN